MNRDLFIKGLSLFALINGVYSAGISRRADPPPILVDIDALTAALSATGPSSLIGATGASVDKKSWADLTGAGSEIEDSYPSQGWIIWPDSKGGLKYKKYNGATAFTGITAPSGPSIQESSYMPQYTSSAAWGSGSHGNDLGGDGYRYDEIDEYDDEAWKKGRRRRKKKKNGKKRRRRPYKGGVGGGRRKGYRKKASQDQEYDNFDDIDYPRRRKTPKVRMTYPPKKKPLWMHIKKWFSK